MQLRDSRALAGNRTWWTCMMQAGTEGITSVISYCMIRLVRGITLSRRMLGNACNRATNSVAHLTPQTGGQRMEPTGDAPTSEPGVFLGLDGVLAGGVQVTLQRHSTTGPP